MTPFRTAHEAWLFGARPHDWRVAIHAPAVAIRTYRGNRRPRWGCDHAGRTHAIPGATPPHRALPRRHVRPPYSDRPNLGPMPQPRPRAKTPAKPRKAKRRAPKRRPAKLGQPPIIDAPRTGPNGEATTVRGLILQALRIGAYIHQAAAYAGVGKTAVMNWAQRGRYALAIAEETEQPIPDDERPYVDFVGQLEKARGDAQVGALNVIMKAAQRGQWQAAAWYLERTMPRDFGRKQMIDLGADDGAGGRMTFGDLAKRVVGTEGDADA